MDLLDDLGPRLRDLTADQQPRQPADRVPLVTRRARRIRRNRALLAAAAALAVLAPVGLLLSTTRNADAPRFAGSDVLTWPDRSDPKEKSASQGALSSYADDVGHTPDHVRWLYRAALDLPNQRRAHLAIFVATEGDASTLVTSLRHDALAQDSSAPGWARSTTPLTATTAPDHVGLYLGYDRDSALDDAPFGNVAVLVADPRARRLTWHEQPLPAAPATAAPPAAGTARSGNGVFVVDAGPLSGPLTAAVTGTRGLTATYPLSLRSVPELRPPAVEVPASWTASSGGSFHTGPTDEGGWSGPMYSTFDTTQAVLATCYGGGSLLADVKGSDGRVLATTRLMCDGRTRQVKAAAPRVRKEEASFTVRSRQLQVVSFVSGRPR